MDRSARTSSRLGKEDSLNSPGDENIHHETPDTRHLSQAYEESSLSAQQLCTFPYPHLAPSETGPSELWEATGVAKENDRIIEAFRLGKTLKIVESNRKPNTAKSTAKPRP